MQRKYITHNIKFHFWVYLWTHISFLGQYLRKYTCSLTPCRQYMHLQETSAVQMLQLFLEGKCIL